MSPAPVAGRSPVAVAAVVAIVVGLVLIVVGFAMEDGGGTDARGTDGSVTPASVTVPTSATVPLPAVDGPFAAGRTPLPGFGEVAITVRSPEDGSIHSFCVLAARTAAQRERGLMAVTDPTLGGYDGMLFLFPNDTDGGFWMRNTPMPLTIAFLAFDGAIVQAVDMAPCSDSPGCRSYAPKGPYRMALEVPRGGLRRLGLTGGAHLSVAGACPARS